MLRSEGDDVSLCRWSSDNFRCDLYVYQDTDGGWSTWVARVRYVGPLVSLTHAHRGEDWRSYYELQRAALASTVTVPIGLEHDGAVFHDFTDAELVRRLDGLARLGYHVPLWVFEQVERDRRTH